MSEFIGWDNYSDYSESDDDLNYKRLKEILIKKFLNYSKNQISVFKKLKIRKKSYIQLLMVAVVKRSSLKEKLMTFWIIKLENNQLSIMIAIQIIIVGK